MRNSVTSGARHHFVNSALKGKLISIVGSVNELDKTTNRRQSPRTRPARRNSTNCALIARDLEDAAIPALSDDRRFATADNAALQTAKMAIASAGYRHASIPGHHRLTFEVVGLALGATADLAFDFFEACRRKRNVIDCDHPSVATHTEADEIVLEARDSLAMVEGWIAASHPKLKP